ncbi:syndecan-1-like [Erpetoichthys calabaricus]|uniref:Syndecan n=2 Tax=Polypteridae TaxID=8289 RepID=A0A8C4X3A1_ERPCA|nr:syndecan-1-like [Erpetoichthys calabaricus]
MKKIRMFNGIVVFVCLATIWIPLAYSDLIPPEDLDTSGDDLEFSGSGEGLDVDSTISSLTPPFTYPNVSTTSISSTIVQTDEKEVPTVQTELASTVAGYVHNYEITNLAVGETISSSVFPLEENEGTINKSIASPSSTTEHLDSSNMESSSLTPGSLPEHPREKNFEMHTESITPTADVTTTFNFVNEETDLASTPVAPELSNAAGGADEIFVQEIMPKIETVPDVKSASAATETDPPLSESGDNERSRSFLERKEVLGGVIVGGIIGLLFAVVLVVLMVYRMKKKDEGSYALDDPKHSNGGYQKPHKQEEFLA